MNTCLPWAPVRHLPRFPCTGRVAFLTLIVAGGLLYSAGVVSTPSNGPAPLRWFGFHEVFHALTVAAFAARYVAISLATY
ncbi:hypothetical protein ACFU6S_43960 [Streptomyces sp. NPDC057456]|uniref:hypothetical protein n=1 Tax=Streptomyces sp. NPDC057456 TaxID=3346139 RepID=UPI00369F4EA5